MRPARPLLAIAALATLTACGSAAPSPSGATSPSPRATMATSPIPSVDTTSWVTFSWPAAGFAVRLPGHPKKASYSQTLDSLVITTRLAAATEGDHRGVLVADAHFSQPVPSTPAAAAELRSSIYGFAGTSGATITSDRATTFRGLRAYEANVTSPHGVTFELIGILKDRSDEIMVLAPEGPQFTAVTGSLRFL